MPQTGTETHADDALRQMLLAQVNSLPALPGGAIPAASWKAPAQAIMTPLSVQ